MTTLVLLAVLAQGRAPTLAAGSQGRDEGHEAVLAETSETRLRQDPENDENFNEEGENFDENEENFDENEENFNENEENGQEEEEEEEEEENFNENEENAPE